MGPALIEAGFRDVTSKIPDGRWAAPGDIIVYQRKDDPDAAGHIDIRTYDGYLSDFLGKELPVRRFKVTGIYRKHFDPEPEWRMRAFLRIIATRESRAVYDSKGYSETFRTLPGVGILQFNDFSEHPFASANADSTASGAYGITRLTWKSYLPFLDLPEKAQRFTPLVQDRLAISIMEQVGNALAHVRLGELEQAVSILRLKQWPSLPGGAQSNKFTISEMRSLFETFLSELRNGKQ
jgi:muramidase (phage lysozyme)